MKKAVGYLILAFGIICLAVSLAYGDLDLSSAQGNSIVLTVDQADVAAFDCVISGATLIDVFPHDASITTDFNANKIVAYTNAAVEMAPVSAFTLTFNRPDEFATYDITVTDLTSATPAATFGTLGIGVAGQLMPHTFSASERVDTAAYLVGKTATPTDGDDNGVIDIRDIVKIGKHLE